jgi:hypothetical protein
MVMVKSFSGVGQRDVEALLLTSSGNDMDINISVEMVKVPSGPIFSGGSVLTSDPDIKIKSGNEGHNGTSTAEHDRRAGALA